MFPTSNTAGRPFFPVPQSFASAVADFASNLAPSSATPGVLHPFTASAAANMTNRALQQYHQSHPFAIQHILGLNQTPISSNSVSNHKASKFQDLTRNDVPTRIVAIDDDEMSNSSTSSASTDISVASHGTRLSGPLDVSNLIGKTTNKSATNSSSSTSSSPHPSLRVSSLPSYSALAQSNAYFTSAAFMSMANHVNAFQAHHHQQQQNQLNQTQNSHTNSLELNQKLNNQLELNHKLNLNQGLNHSSLPTVTTAPFSFTSNFVTDAFPAKTATTAGKFLSLSPSSLAIIYEK